MIFLYIGSEMAEWVRRLTADQWVPGSNRTHAGHLDPRSTHG